MGLRERDKEIIVPVFNYYINKILEFCSSVKDFAFSVDYVFLKIESNIFSDAEILHRVGDTNSQLVAYSEEMIDTRFTCKDDSRKIENIDFLLAEILGRDTFNLAKRFEINLQVILFGQIIIR